MKKNLEKKQKNNLANIRKSKDISQSKLAELTNIPIQTLQKYEQGERDINKAQGIYLYKIANALECEMKDLLNI